MQLALTPLERSSY